MVRVGTLPLRLLALQYGADLVYSPEIIDKKIITCQRVFQEKSGTWRYETIKDKRHVFETHPSEKSRLIFQLGTADPELALQAALVVKQDVGGIDLNCGCPKHFSIQGGMGAALLDDPPRLEKILRTLVTKTGLPISCKIRLKKNLEETLSLCKMIESTGVVALTVHGRTREERPKHAAHWDQIGEIRKIIRSIPIIANGDIFTPEDIDKVKAETGVTSVMMARGAMWNVSLFKHGLGEAPLPPYEVYRAYLKQAHELNNMFANTKYTLMQMIEVPSPASDQNNPLNSDIFKKLQQSKTYKDLFNALGLEWKEAGENNEEEGQKRAAPDFPTMAEEDSLNVKKLKLTL